ncbi:hypothetical protein NLI96_g8421 [Meripilus lineatus]|uniref:lytic cellulose monooxygenase (C4-dehydrogenating) n=1 Tax=Meripilus lineatus TaxID=2056292 RepID=A0AAD5UXL6_9APHY|nr:hypothetical protein NLI96_g8421 [Physisporinus lineatus]
MFTILTTIVVALSLVIGTHGHGYVHELEIGGKSYTGFLPFSDPWASPVPERVIRKIPNDGPILDIHDPNLACNVGGNKGTKVIAKAAAGSKVTFKWEQWPTEHYGPVSVYMTSCNGDCSKFNPSGAKWFKVDAQGYDSKNKKWASTKLIEDNVSWTSTIPSALAPGQYLIRHEIIALHDVNAPQFYPSCAQVEITGNGNRAPAPENLVSIPGLYNNVKFPNIWDPFGTFAAPGPAPAFTGGDKATPSPVKEDPVPASSSKVSSTRAANSTPTTKSPSVAAAPNAAPNKSSSSAPPSATGKCRSRKARRALRRHASLAKRFH